MTMHPFNLIGVNIRRRHFNGCRQINDCRLVGCRLPYIHHRFTHIQGIIQFGAGKALRAVLQAQMLGAGFGQTLGDHFGAINGNLFNPVTVAFENHPPL